MNRTAIVLVVFVQFIASTIGPADVRADDFKDQLPRVPAKSPDDSRKAIALNEGFRAELVAAEPLVRDPVAVDIDERGRMYVVQLPSYNGYVIDGFQAHGSVVLLDDTDDDGRYDKRTPFADKLTYPTAVACWDGGVFVGDAPDLLYLKDTDGDGKADQRQVVFTGFGSDRAGEAHLNSIRWGLDNRFHLSTSLSGGNVKAAAAKNAKPVSVRGRGLIFDPRDLSRFELTSGGGQHGMSMDDWGRKFVCSNSVPAQTLMYDDRYVARNPQLAAPEAAVNIAPDGKHTKLFRISPPEPWRVLRTRLRREGKFRGSAEGGKPFGFFTGATGVTIYRGDAWPDEYHGNLLVGDVANNLIYRARLEAKGLELVARRADAGAEFLASKDIWFRPVQFAGAPDGTMYVLDMYRELIEGAAFLPPDFFEHLDPVSGNSRGRIYRIAPAGFSRRPAPRLGQAGTAELVALLEHRNGWHRDTASRLLYQRQDKTAVTPLRKLAAQSELPIGRVTALYALDGLGVLGEQTLLDALDDPSPDARVHVLRLAEKLAADSAALRVRLAQMVDDPDQRVRYQLAFSLGALPGRSASVALAKLALHDAKDRWMRIAILSSFGQGADVVFPILIANEEFRRASHGRELLNSLASQIGAAGRKNELAVVLKSLNGLAAADKRLSESLVQSLVEKQKGKTRERLLAAAGGKAGAILGDLLREAKETADDEGAPIEQRVEAIRTLRLARFDEVESLLNGLLDLSQPQPVQAAVLETVAGFSEDAVAELLLAVWPGLSPTLRTRAAETLLSRPAWVDRFLDAVEKGDVKRGDVDPARIQLLKQHPDKAIAARVARLFAGERLTARKQVVDRYQKALDIPGNGRRGKQVFKKNCSACHQLEGVGKAIGADLKGIRQRGLPSVMLNVLDPNREVKPKFLTYVLVTTDGRVLTGMIASETANSITIRRSDGTSATVQRVDIENLKSTGLSFMPEGLEKEIDVQAMSDLLNYLNSIE